MRFYEIDVKIYDSLGTITSCLVRDVLRVMGESMDVQPLVVI